MKYYKYTIEYQNKLWTNNNNEKNQLILINHILIVELKSLKYFYQVRFTYLQLY